MEIISDRLHKYLDNLVPPRSAEMQAMEAYAKATNFPIIGPTAGYFCYQIARLINARSVFEMGSGFGYSTAWFAKAVNENGGGIVHHVVWDNELSNQARNHLVKLGYRDAIQFHVGEAVHILKQSSGPFDLIFNDIDKEGYPESLPVIKQKLRPGGVLLIDNMLLGGRIFDINDRAPITEGVRQFTKMITADEGWIVSLVPIRDGIILAYKC